MPNAPICPWCGKSVPTMLVEAAAVRLDDVKCPGCAKEIPRRLLG
ncbi:MAG: hypothetical protein WDA16_07535 [Candidatus Thermoplasmatota archaeon]